MMTAMQQLHKLGFRRIGLAMHDIINRESEYRFMGGYHAAINCCCSGLADIPTLLLKEGIAAKAAFLSWVKEYSPKLSYAFKRSLWNGLMRLVSRFLKKSVLCI